MSIAEISAEALPTHLDLPCTDGKPVDNGFQLLQTMLLFDGMMPYLDSLLPDGNYFLGSDQGIYWRRTQEPLDGCKAPDFVYVPGVPKLLNGMLRRSYVLWQEKVHPRLVIEYVSGSGAEERDDTPETGKFWIYEQVIQAKYYLIHDPVHEELVGFELRDGKYEPMEPNDRGRLAVDPIKLEFGIWHGEYSGSTMGWLRVWNLDGDLLPSNNEVIEEERQRAERLAARLRELGIDPNAI